MSKTALGFVIGLVVLPLGCGVMPKSPPSSVTIGSPKAKAIGIEREDLDAARGRLLAALDAGDVNAAATELDSPKWKPEIAKPFASILRAYDAPGPTRHPKLLANVVPIRVGAIPPVPTRNPKEAKLVAARVTSQPGARERAWENEGHLFPEQPGEAVDLPNWLPARLGDKPIRRLRASDGRWLALWGDRYLAILGGRATVLLDFAAWSETAPAERVSIEWADLSDDVVYVKTRRPVGGGFIAAIAVSSGKPLWRSEDGAFTESFVVANTTLVAWRYGERRGGGELLTIRRDTGATAARRTTSDVDGDCRLKAAGGLVHCFASSELIGGTGLKHDESLEIQEPAPAPTPPTPEPSNESIRIAEQAPVQGPDARAAAWKFLDLGDPRGAILALGPHLGERPTDIAALALDEIARKSLEAAREEAAKEILANHPPVTASEIPKGPAPVKHTTKGRLVVVSQKSITPQQMFSEFPTRTDDERLLPAYVPIILGPRGRNEDAGALVGSDERVEIYWGVGSRPLSVWFRGAKVHSVLEHPNEVRASNAIGDVLLTVVRVAEGDKGVHFYLEAHDGKTGSLYYRSKERLSDQYIVVQDGYVVASTEGPADIVLLAADTGRVVSRVHLATPQYPFLLFRKGQSIMGVNMQTSVTLAVE